MLFLKVTVKAVTKLDNKAAHCHSPVTLRHCPFLWRVLDCLPHHFLLARPSGTPYVFWCHAGSHRLATRWCSWVSNEMIFPWGIHRKFSKPLSCWYTVPVELSTLRQVTVCLVWVENVESHSPPVLTTRWLACDSLFLPDIYDVSLCFPGWNHLTT